MLIGGPCPSRATGVMLLMKGYDMSEKTELNMNSAMFFPL